ncbi:putative adenylate kinase, mitochondrial [Sesamum angolense]|uniref:adenylate kinase n=1 Tax=Sesamum angolense TaxID=2727404 RepID=A0AAE2BPK3_9LAMI|nr:putative adenylate kinase, mitochondrial [Sesamum angolense]
MSVLSRLGVAVRPSSRLSRGYGSAAAAQLDYDYYHGYDDEGDHHQGKMNRWKHWGEIASSVNQGKLVPEDVIFGLLSKRLEEGYCRGETGFILDGIPRTRMQAEILDQIADIDLVLNLKCTEESMMKKTSGNGIYSPSREFHSMATSGLNLGLQPQSGHFQSSNADTDTIWQEKLRMYSEQRKPIEEYYKQQKKLLDFQVAGGPGESWQGLLAALQLQHMNSVTCAGSSSQKLTA